MQRRLRIALAVTAAAGAALLGTGTAFADSFTDIVGGTSQASPSYDQRGPSADSDDSDSDSSDSDDASSNSGDDDNSSDNSSDDSGSDDN
ncbi:MAG TPA: hypothetical protein VH008_21730 [Pseudonocardia sp.]|jgi:hypothetical protein|nr:hypothetical protein [Pseudonocardia sp.]